MPQRALPWLGLVFLLSTSAAAARPVAAQPPPVDDWHLVGEWHTVANPDDVRAIARSGDAIWVGTDGGGAVRWAPDGTALRQYLAPQDGLPCNDVRDIAHWRGMWWFATCRGLAVYDPARDRMSVLPAELPSPSVTALAVDAKGRLWAGTEPWWDPTATFEGKAEPGGWSGGGVARTEDGDGWTAFADGLPSRRVTDLVEWRGQVWAATRPAPTWVPPSRDFNDEPVPGRWDDVGGGVARHDGAAWTAFDAQGTDALSDTTLALAAGTDALWVATWGRGLVAHDGARWASLPDCGNPSRCIRDNFVTAVSVSDDGAVWVGTARFNGHGTGIQMLDARGTPLDPDDDGWYGLGEADGLPGELVHALAPAGDAGMWLGAAWRDPAGRVHGRGLTRLAADRQTFSAWRATAVGSGAPADNDITAVAFDAATDRLYVGTDRAGLSVREPDGRWRTHTRATTGGGLGSDSIADLALEPDGTLWVATRQTTYDAKRHEWVDGGLSRLEAGEWTRLAGPDSGLPSDHLSALALDGRGKLYVGTGATDRGPKEHAFRGWGLAAIDTGSLRWERTYTFPTLTSNNVTDLFVAHGKLHVATAYFFYVDTRPGGAQFNTGGGLSILDLASGSWQRMTDAEGLTVAVRTKGLSGSRGLIDLRSVLVDPEGTIWAGGQAYPDATYEEGAVPDGVIDEIRLGDVSSHRFAGAGPVSALRDDGVGHVWAASQTGGVRIRVDGRWLHQAAVPGGLPTDRLTDMSFEDGAVWLGTRGEGLVRLVPPPPTTPGAGAEPGEPIPGLLVQTRHRAYLPVALRQPLVELVGR